MQERTLQIGFATNTCFTTSALLAAAFAGTSTVASSFVHQLPLSQISLVMQVGLTDHS